MSITVMFGKIIRQLRKGKAFSQEAPAEKCGLHNTYIGQIERGEKNASLESIQKLSEGLEITVAQLFENFSVNFNEKSPATEIAEKVSQMTEENQLHILNIINEISQIN